MMRDSVAGLVIFLFKLTVALTIIVGVAAGTAALWQWALASTLGHPVPFLPWFVVFLVTGVVRALAERRPLRA